MKRTFLGYGRQEVDDADIAAVIDTLKSDFLTQGPAVERFESALAERVGARHAVAVANGTAALHVACLAAGIGPRDLALVPTMTFVATANAPVYCGATMRLADIDTGSRSLAPATVERFIAENPETKAVLPVHFAGLASGSPEIRNAATNRIVIEDGCHALGGEYEDGQPIGGCAYSDMTVFSFHPVKPITTGEGGAVTTNDDAFAHRLRMFRNHGIERDPDRWISDEGSNEAPSPWFYEQQALGFNYRMTDIQAALGLSQISKLDAFRARRLEIAQYYDARLGKLDNVDIPQADPKERARSGLYLYQLDIDFDALGRTRTQVMADLKKAGIGTQVHYIPVHRQPFYKSYGKFEVRDFPVAERHYAGTLSIPLFPSMTDEDAEFVVETFTDLLS